MHWPLQIKWLLKFNKIQFTEAITSRLLLTRNQTPIHFLISPRIDRHQQHRVCVCVCERERGGREREREKPEKYIETAWRNCVRERERERDGEHKGEEDRQRNR